jgi:hypothetical protein
MAVRSYSLAYCRLTDERVGPFDWISDLIYKFKIVHVRGAFPRSIGLFSPNSSEQWTLQNPLSVEHYRERQSEFGLFNRLGVKNSTGKLYLSSIKWKLLFHSPQFCLTKICGWVSII